MLAYLANGEFDHDRCEATVSTIGANHDVMSNRSTERRHLWKHHHIRILLWI